MLFTHVFDFKANTCIKKAWSYYQVFKILLNNHVKLSLMKISYFTLYLISSFRSIVVPSIVTGYMHMLVKTWRYSIYVMLILIYLFSLLIHLLHFQVYFQILIHNLLQMSSLLKN